MYFIQFSKKLEAQWAESVSLIFHSALSLRKLNTEPSISPCDNKSASLWIRFDYFFHV